MNTEITLYTNTPADISDSNWNQSRKLLLELETNLSRLLELKDTTCLRVTLAAYVANKLNAVPVWLFLVGPPSCGKSELLKLIINLDEVLEASTLTEGALLSGSPKRETSKSSSGGLLRKLKDRGIILLKDFTSIMQMNKDARSHLTSALREIYDGRWTRWFGSDGGKSAHWEGKLGIIAAVTPAIDTRHSIRQTMGARFLMYRIHTDPETRLLQTQKALEMTEYSSILNNELKQTVLKLIENIQFPDKLPMLSKLQFEQFKILAFQIAQCRSSAIRGAYSRVIDFVPEPESPNRIVKQFRTLFHALQLIGCSNQEAWKAIREVGFSSMTELRWKILKALYKDSTHSIISLASRIQQSEPSIRRQLEELKMFGITESFKEGKKDIWRLTETVSNDFDVIFMPFDEKSDSDVVCDNFSEISGDLMPIDTDTQLTFRKSNTLIPQEELIGEAY